MDLFTWTEEDQSNFMDNLNKSEAGADRRQPEAGRQYTHKHAKGLTIVLISPTAKGWKVRQTEIFNGWTDRKLRRPKTKIAFFSDAELKELFIIN